MKRILNTHHFITCCVHLHVDTNSISIYTQQQDVINRTQFLQILYGGWLSKDNLFKSELVQILYNWLANFFKYCSGIIS